MVQKITLSCGSEMTILAEGTPLCQEDIDYIENRSFPILFNDIDCYHFSCSEHLPSGRWLSDINWTNNLKEVTARANQ